MMSTLHHPLVVDYLARLEAAAASLSPARRAELITDLGGHIEEAVSHTDGSQGAVAGVLDRLGPPEEVASEAGAAPPAHPSPAAPPAASQAPTLELWSLALMVFAIAVTLTVSFAFIAPVFTVVGLALALISSRWTVPDKVLAVLSYGLLGPTVLIVTFGLSVFSGSCTVTGDSEGNYSEVCTGGGPAWAGTAVWIGLILIIGLWAYTGIRLYRRAVAADGTPLSRPGTTIGIIAVGLATALLLVVVWMFFIFGLRSL